MTMTSPQIYGCETRASLQLSMCQCMLRQSLATALLVRLFPSAASAGLHTSDMTVSSRHQSQVQCMT